MDIIRNICVKEKIAKDKEPANEQEKVIKRSKSFPNLLFIHKKESSKRQNKKEVEPIQQAEEQQLPETVPDPPEFDPQPDRDPEADPENGEAKNEEEEEVIECAISGKLEIRVVAKEASPNLAEESVYYDAITNGAKSAESKSLHDLSISNRNKYQDVKQFFEDNFAPAQPPLPTNFTQQLSSHNPKIVPMEDDKWIKFDENGDERKPPPVKCSAGAISKIFKEPIPPFDLDEEETGKILLNKENQLFCDIKNILNENINNNLINNTKNINNIISNNNNSPLSDKFKVVCDDPKVNDDCGKLLKSNENDTDELDDQKKSSEQIAINNLAMKKEINYCSNFTSSSKIPILSSNLRLSKCASWSGNDNAHPDLTDLTPGKEF